MVVSTDYAANPPVNLYNIHPLFQCMHNLLSHLIYPLYLR